MSMLSPTCLIYVCFTDRKAVALTLPFLERDDKSRGYLLACYLCPTDTDASAQPQYAAGPSDCPREREIIELYIGCQSEKLISLSTILNLTS